MRQGLRLDVIAAGERRRNPGDSSGQGSQGHREHGSPASVDPDVSNTLARVLLDGRADQLLQWVIGCEVVVEGPSVGVAGEEESRMFA